jgi:DNA replicative helicase MCM subunit Mcm2 (Cdc46/Mcm family)
MVSAVAKPKGPGEEVERRVLTLIESMASNDVKGAQWDQIVAHGEKDQLTEDQIEEALNSLMDKGLIYEPILGRLKVT